MKAEVYKGAFCTRREPPVYEGSTQTGHEKDEFKGGEIELRNFKIGDAFNLYEDITLNAKWDVREHKKSSTIMLGRGHMFYSLPESNVDKIHKAMFELGAPDEEVLNQSYADTDLFNTIPNMNASLIKNGITGSFDTGTVITSGYETPPVETDIINIISRNGIRRMSENHFAISGHNLIYSEIAVNENVFNTVSHHYKRLGFFNNSLLLSIVNLETDKYIKEVVVAPPIAAIDSGISTNNIGRNLEYFSNIMITNLESTYSGKIFMKYNADIETGDTITLIDDVNSTFAILRVDTFEHSLDRNGLVTIVNVKACVDVRDMALDSYYRNITLDLAYELNNSVLKDSEDLKANRVLKNIYNYYLKTIIQLPKYCTLYHKEEKGFFDKTFPIANGNMKVPQLPIRFIPMMKKGKAQIPTPLEPAFYSIDDKYKSFLMAMYENIRDKFIGTYNKFTAWSADTARYLADFLISFPTMGLHELFKPILGITYKNSIESAFSKDDDSDNENMLKQIIDGESYFSGDFSNGIKNEAFSIGFFNVMAQNVKRNLNPIAGGEQVAIPDEKIKAVYNEKVDVIRSIINKSFDVTLCVEMYEGFKHEALDINIESFAEEIKGGNITESKHKLFANNYGSEYGYVFSNSKSISAIEEHKLVSMYGGGQYVDQYESSRKAVETTIDLSSVDVEFHGISKIKIVWFHNLFGDDIGIPARKENIRKILEVYSQQQEGIGVIIMGDFNLQMYNSGSKPKRHADADGNATMEIDEVYGFKNFINKPTTLNKKGQVKSNIFDNVLLSKNLCESGIKERIVVSRLNYQYHPKNIISDHIPVFVSFLKSK